MLFRTRDGTIKEINLFDCNNDHIYYNKVMDLKKDILKNVNLGVNGGEKKESNTLHFFSQKSSK